MSEWNVQLQDDLVALRHSFLSSQGYKVEELEAAKQRLTSAGSPPDSKTWDLLLSTLRSLAASIKDEQVPERAIESAKTAMKTISDSAGLRVPPEARTGKEIGDLVVGSYGMFTALVLSQDYVAASILLFRTTEQYPAAAVQVFPMSAYRSDYREILRRSHHELVRTVRTHGNLERANKSKKFRRIPTQIYKTFVIIPFYYVVSLFVAMGPLSESTYPGRRRSGYSAKLDLVYREMIRKFDQNALENGWLIGRNQIQKEEMLYDQVKRITSIFNNHCLTASQEARAKRRDIEGRSALVS